MKYEIKDVNQCIKELKVIIPAERAQADYRTVLGQFKNYATVPGFRRGKAPMSMVENLFGEKAKESYLQEKLNEYYLEALKESEIIPMFEGYPTDVTWDKGQDLTATFRIEIKPQPDIAKHKDLEIEYTEFEYLESMRDDSIKGTLDRITDPEIIDGPVEEGDGVAVTLVDKYGGEIGPQFLFIGQGNFGEQLDDQLLGLMVGDSFEGEMILGEDTKEGKITIDEIRRTVLPELTDEIAKDLDYDSAADMLEKVEQDIRKQVEQANREGKKAALLAKLVELNPFDVPPTAVYSYAMSMAEPYAKMMNQAAEELAKYFTERAEKEMKYFYTIRDLVEKLNIEVNDEDKQELIKEYAEQSQLTVEEYLERNPGVTNKEDFVYSVKDRKVVDYLIGQNTFIPKKVEEVKPEEKEDSDEEKE
ncbi:MAG: trigger factor [Candidatus Cloacimonas sp.]|nr:trigger factor [Candidatus Cloacimonadota bacterium]